MSRPFSRVLAVRGCVLLVMGLGLLTLGGFVFRQLVNSTSDIAFGGVYVLGPLVVVASAALLVSAVRTWFRKD